MLTSSHVVAPWKWSKYYPEDWLRNVNEKHTHYTVELRHTDGMFITSLDLLPTSYHHQHRDVALLKFEEEDDAINTLAEHNYSPLLLNGQDSLSPDDVCSYACHSSLVNLYICLVI